LENTGQLKIIFSKRSDRISVKVLKPNFGLLMLDNVTYPAIFQFVVLKVELK